jgi:hypothetical protein
MAIGTANIDKAIRDYVMRGTLPNLDLPNLLAFYAGIAQARKAIRAQEKAHFAMIEADLIAGCDECDDPDCPACKFVADELR